jgi:hypothetical protein
MERLANALRRKIQLALKTYKPDKKEVARLKLEKSVYEINSELFG